jgi:porphyrinogen peroxidase
MSQFQPGILAPSLAAGRYLSFSVAQPARVAETLRALCELVDGEAVVLGIGQSLAEQLGKTVPGLMVFPDFSAHGVTVPATPGALWLWVRADDPGTATVRVHALEHAAAPAFKLDTVVNAFLGAERRDLSGYVDGTENPVGEDAEAAAFVSGAGAGLDGSSFVAVQQWQHDFAKVRALAGETLDNIVGRRRDDNEELDDAPASAHVKRTAQESFEPEAFLLRRSMPWAEGARAGLYFVGFGSSFRAFEVQMRRMAGYDDAIHDGLFRFTTPVTGAYFWCPPMRDGRLDLTALGL